MKKQLNEEFKRMQKLAGLTEGNKSLSNIEQFINDKDFMESFIANAEESYEYFGDFKCNFMLYLPLPLYEEEGLTDEQIGDLLEYCDKNDLISY